MSVCAKIVSFAAYTHNELPHVLTDRGGCALLPPTGQCGKVRPAPRVIGGHDAKLGQFPWAALIYASRGFIPQTLAGRLISGFNFGRSKYLFI